MNPSKKPANRGAVGSAVRSLIRALVLGLLVGGAPLAAAAQSAFAGVTVFGVGVEWIGHTGTMARTAWRFP